MWPKPGGRYPILIAIGICGNALIEGPGEVVDWMREFSLYLDDAIASLPEKEGVYRGDAVFFYRPGDRWEIEDDSHFIFENAQPIDLPAAPTPDSQHDAQHDKTRRTRGAA